MSSSTNNVAESTWARAEQMIAMAKLFGTQLGTRMVRVGVVFAFGGVWLTGTAIAIVSQPDASERTRLMLGLMAFGSLFLCVASTVIALLSIFGAYCAERLLREEREEEYSHDMAHIGLAFHMLVKKHLRNASFRREICRAMSIPDPPSDVEVHPDRISMSYFSGKEVANAIDSVELEECVGGPP